MMKGTHYMEQDTEMDRTGHCRHVTVQDPHYTGQDTAEDRTLSDRTLSREIKEMKMTKLVTGDVRVWERMKE